jgi:hypothetical protein
MMVSPHRAHFWRITVIGFHLAQIGPNNILA